MKPVKDMKSFSQESKGLFKVYKDFFGIITKKSSEIAKLRAELEKNLAFERCELISIERSDMAFLSVISKGVGVSDSSLEIEVAPLFAIIKWFCRNNRQVLEDSRLYYELSRQPGVQITMVSEAYTQDKIRLVFKYIDAEPNVLMGVMEKVQLLPTHQWVMVTLWEVVRNLKSKEIQKDFVKLLKSEEFACMIHCLFSKFISVDLFNDFTTSIDVEGMEAVFNLMMYSLIESPPQHITSIKVNLVAPTNLTLEELKAENQELKSQYKEKVRSESFEEKPEIFPETEVSDQIENKKYSIDFRLSLEEKKSIIKDLNLLLIKSEDVSIVPVMPNVKVVDIQKISAEMFREDYDAVVLLAKNIWHKDVYRLKSFLNGKNLLYTSRTNRSLIIDDIYNQI